MDKLLKGKEVAEILGVSSSFAYQLIRQGEIPALHLGKAVRVRPKDLAVFIGESVTSGSDLNIPLPNNR